MFSNCVIENFRGFRRLEMPRIAKVNLITGRNNVGKTALLEALFILSGEHNPDLTTVVNGMRGMSKVSLDLVEVDEFPWDSIFYGFNTSVPMRLSAQLGQDYLNLRFTSVIDVRELSGLSQAVQRAYRKISVGDKPSAKILKMEVRKDRIRQKRFNPDQIDPRRYFLIFDGEGKKVDPPLPLPPFPARFHSGHLRSANADDASRFARIQLRGQEPLITEALQILEPRLRSVAVVVENGEPSLQGNVGLAGRRFIPLHMMGDGMSKVATIVMLIASTRGGVLFVDDFDSGLHYSSLADIWKSIRKALDLFDVQLFATTHRSESVSAAHEIFADADAGGFLAHRLERAGDGTIVLTYDKEALEGALEAGLEVR
jgi:hypothetical protein